MAFDFPNAPTVGQQYTPAGGPTYQWDGTTWKIANVLEIADAPSDGNTYARKNGAWLGGVVTSMVETLITSTQVYNKPANLKFIEVEGSAGGGSGSGQAATAATTWAVGAGGGGGAWGKNLFPASSLPASLTITVGSGGAASAVGGAGVAGGASSFGALMSLPGGNAGAQGANTTSAGNARTAATAQPSGVSLGGPGGASDYVIVNTGGISIVGQSGHNPYGTPAPMLYVTAGSSVSSIVGDGYGSGSGGGVSGNNQAARASLAGQPGFFRIREYF